VSSRANQQRREDCRLAVLEVLAERPATAHHPAAIERVLRRPIYGYDFTEAEAAEACAFHVSDGSAVEHTHAMGATKSYQITSDGTRRHERGGAL